MSILNTQAQQLCDKLNEENPENVWEYLDRHSYKLDESKYPDGVINGSSTIYLAGGAIVDWSEQASMWNHDAIALVEMPCNP